MAAGRIRHDGRRLGWLRRERYQLFLPTRFDFEADEIAWHVPDSGSCFRLGGRGASFPVERV